MTDFIVWLASENDSDGGTDIVGEEELTRYEEGE